MIRATRVVLSLCAPAGLLAAAAALSAAAASAAAASTPSPTTLVDGVLKNLSKVSAIEMSATTGPLKEHLDFLPKKTEAYATETASEDGVTVDLQYLEVGKTPYLKANLGGLEFMTLGSVSTAKLTPLANKWYIVPPGKETSIPSNAAPTMSGLGRLLCVSPSASSSASANGSSSTASTGASCSLSGTTVTSYAATKAVISSKGLGNETVTFTAVNGKLLPTEVTAAASNTNTSTSTANGSTSASSSVPATTATFSYPSSAPSLPTPTGATKLPASLAANLS